MLLWQLPAIAQLPDSLDVRAHSYTTDGIDGLAEIDEALGKSKRFLALGRQWDSTLTYGRKALALIKLHGDTLYKQEALEYMFVLYMKFKMLPAADSCVNAFIRFARSRGDVHGEYKARAEAVNIHFFRGEKDSVRTKCVQLIPYFEKRQDHFTLSSLYLLCGTTWCNEDHERAMEYLLKACEEDQWSLLPTDLRKFNILALIADLQHRMHGTVSDSLKALFSDIRDNGHADSEVESMVSLFWAEYHLQRLELQPAIPLLWKTLSLADKPEVNALSLRAIALLGFCYAELENSDSAAYYRKKSEWYRDSLGLPQNVPYSLQHRQYWRQYMWDQIDRYQTDYARAEAKSREYRWQIILLIWILTGLATITGYFVWLARQRRRHSEMLQQLIASTQNMDASGLEKQGNTGSSQPLTGMLQERFAQTEDCSQITAGNLAEWAGMSASTLSRELKIEVGLTPGRFLRELKLFRGKLLLEQKKVRSVADAAYLSGFTKVDYFSRIFKQRFGESPSAVLRRR